MLCDNYFYFPFYCPFFEQIHCVKSLQNWSFSGPYFPIFGLKYLSVFISNAGIYGPEKLQIRTLHAVNGEEDFFESVQYAAN